MSLEEDIHYLDENIKAVNDEWSVEDTKVKKQSIFKRLIRKLTYWLYKPMWEQQVEFNKRTAAALSDIYRILSQLTDENNVQISKVREDLISDEKPCIVQLVSSLNFGDAVGNEVLSFKRELQKRGFKTEIFAETIHKKIPANAAEKFNKLPELREQDIVIYHFSSKCGMFETVKKLKCKVIMRYHNVTPPIFFHGFDANAEKVTATGLKQAQELKDYVDYCLPVSEFNKNDLLAMGYTCPMTVVPILIQFEDYAQKPAQTVIDKYNDGITNILFVGRMAPNKKVEDVISCFEHYKRVYDNTARLFLVGSFGEEDKYYLSLKKLIKKLGVQDVIFPGHIPFNEILAYYKVADVFLCLSEHEGFCVPLVEAMYFRVPIIAYDSSAISSTLGGSGVLIEDKAPENTAAEIHKLIDNKAVADTVVEQQSARLRDFDNEIITNEMMYVLVSFVKIK